MMKVIYSCSDGIRGKGMESRSMAVNWATESSLCSCSGLYKACIQAQCKLV